ncbi:MAG TPA: prephenate dehydratase [Alphaproteobacteria bacterium]|nr:prephenate dehydratase [Alphaproteobacteria bacterium]
MPRKSGTQKIAFQGRLGAYSHTACVTAFHKLEPLPCTGFAEAFHAAETGKAAYAMIPIDNSIAGRVADIHNLLPASPLTIVAEHFIPVHHCLLGVPGAQLEDVKTVYSHVHALPQCKKFIAAHHLKPVVFEDTAGSAAKVAEMGDKSYAAIASGLAAELYGLKILKRNIEDESGNTTRFIILTKGAKLQKRVKGKKYLTSIIFKVRNIPAALYKALGGFATNGINITKLESYLEGNKFHSARFYCEVEGHPDDIGFEHALDELRFYAADIRMLGTYPCHSFRAKAS